MAICDGVSRLEVSQIFNHLSVLLDAGVAMDRALRSLGASSTSPRMGAVCANLWQVVTQGGSLSDAMVQMPRAFSALQVASVRAGEGAGALPTVLREVARSEERDLSLLRSVTAGLTYPMTVLLFGLLLLGFLGNRVFASLLPMLVSSGRELPLATRIVAFFTDLLSRPAVVVVGIVALGLGGRQLLVYLRTDAGRAVRDRLVLRMPLFGGLARALFVARFCDHLSLMMRSGMPLVPSLTTATAMVANTGLRADLARVIPLLKQATPLEDVLRMSGCFPRAALALIAVGETSGELLPILGRLGPMYETEAQHTLEAVVKLLEPIVILILGFMVAGIIIATMVPMYQMLAT